jgi:hypothetical protein
VQSRPSSHGVSSATVAPTHVSATQVSPLVQPLPSFARQALGGRAAAGEKRRCGELVLAAARGALDQGHQVPGAGVGISHAPNWLGPSALQSKSVVVGGPPYLT